MNFKMDFNIILFWIIVLGVILSLIYFFYKEIYSKKIEIKDLIIPKGVIHKKFDGVDDEITFNNKETTLVVEYKKFFEIFRIDEYFLESTLHYESKPVFIDKKISLYYFEADLYIVINSQTYKIILK